MRIWIRAILNEYNYPSKHCNAKLLPKKWLTHKCSKFNHHKYVNKKSNLVPLNSFLLYWLSLGVYFQSFRSVLNWLSLALPPMALSYWLASISLIANELSMLILSHIDNIRSFHVRRWRREQGHDLNSNHVQIQLPFLRFCLRKFPNFSLKVYH